MEALDPNMKRKYSFSDYDPAWPQKFDILKRTLSSVFGEKALQIEHIGSTSVPGMKAKPLIDVLIVVEKMEDFKREEQKMKEAGYEGAKDYIAPNTLFFYRVDARGEKLENIHLCPKDSFKVRQFLAMRDFFRAFPEKAKEYSRLKEKNSRENPDDYPAYRAAKAPFLKKMEQKAYEWIERERSS